MSYLCYQGYKSVAWENVNVLLYNSHSSAPDRLAACAVPLRLCRAATRGKGIVRLLFCLYLESKYVEVAFQFVNDTIIRVYTTKTSNLGLNIYPKRVANGG